jgi:hypothetical protein
MPTTPHVNDQRQSDYALWFDESRGRWIIHARGRNTGEIRALEVQIECPVRSRGRLLFCRAELIVNGMTNHCAVTVECNEAKLRTLVVHDQVIQALQIPAFGSLKVPK